MDALKKTAIEQIVDSNIKTFASTLSEKHISQVNNPNGIINSKRKNVFIDALESEEFKFYSAFVRSFDSAFGKVLENMGNAIAKLTFETTNEINSYLLPAQESKIAELKNWYSTDAENRIMPNTNHYDNFTCIIPNNLASYRRRHATDHCFYNREKNEYYIMELKAGCDLDKTKASSQKEDLLVEYFMLKNKLNEENKNIPIKLYMCVGYNKDGEGNYWKQANVRNNFADNELIIGRDYWNFVCDDPDGFNVVINQYRISSHHISEAIQSIREAYN